MVVAETGAPVRSTINAAPARPLPSSLRLAAFLVLLLLGAWLRFAHPQAIEFSDDQSWALTLATELLAGDGDPLRGPVATSGSAHPPHLAYLLAVPLLVSRDPWLGWWLGTTFIAALSLLVVPTAFRVAELLFGTRWALLAGLVAAVSPAGIAFGRKIWGPSSSFGFEAIALLALLLLLRDGRGRWLALGVTAITLGAMLHPSNVFFAPIAGVVALARLRSVGWRWILTTAAAVAVILAPLVVRELRDGATYFDGVFRAASGGAGVQVSADALRLVARIAGGDAYGWLSGTSLGPRLPALGLDLPGASLLLLTVTGSLILCGLVARAAVRRHWTRAGSLALLLAWLWWPALGNLRHSRELEEHWFLGTIVAVGPVVAALAYAGRRIAPVRFGVIAAVVLIATLQVGEWQAHLRRVLEVGPDTAFKMPLVYSLAAARIAAGESDGQPVMIANPNGMNSVFAYLARGRFLTRRFDDLHTWVVPENESGVYVADQTRSLHAAPPGAEIVRSRRGREMYAIMPVAGFDSLPAPPGFRGQALAARLAGVVQYEAASFPRSVGPGEAFDVRVRWRIVGSQAGLPVELHEFGHFVGEQGEQIAGEDFRGFPVESWSPGDLVVSRFRIVLDAAAEPGRYWLDVGMYEPNTLARLPVESTGQPPVTTVRVGPIVVRRPATTPVPPTVLSGARIGDVAELVGYDLQRSGEVIHVRLVWRSLATTDETLTVFAQALSGDNRLVGQHDGQPAGGAWPTSSWLPGDVIEDTFDLPLDETGRSLTEVRVIVGIYRLPSVERLPVRDASGSPAGDFVDLGHLK